MLTLQFEDIILLLALWLFAGLFSALVFIRFSVLRWAGKAVTNALRNPDEDTKQAIGTLLKMMLAVPIETGRRIKDDDGKEIDEKKPFLLVAGRELIRQFFLQYNAKIGGEISGVGATLEAEPELKQAMKGRTFGIPKKDKDETTLEWALRVAVQTPQGQQIIGKMASKLDQKISEPVSSVVKYG